MPGPTGDSGQRAVMLGSECRQKSPQDWQRFVTHAKNTLWFKRCWLCINSSYQHGGAETASASTWASMFAPSQRAAGCCLPAPSQPTPVAAGSSEPLGMGETPASTPSQPSALGSKPSVKRQWEKRGLGVFFLYCAQRVPALGFSRTGLVGRSAGAAKPGPSSLSWQSCAEVGAHKSRGTEDARSDPGHHPGCSCSGLAWHLYQF